MQKVVDRADMPGGGTVELLEHRYRSGRGWLFFVSSTRNVGGSGISEMSGFPTIEAAREAFEHLRRHGPARDRPLLEGGTTHAELRGRLSLGGTPGGPPEVEQVWAELPVDDD